MADSPSSDSTPAAYRRPWFILYGRTYTALIATTAALIWLNIKPEVTENSFEPMWADIYFGWPVRCAVYSGPHYAKKNLPAYGYEYFTINWNYVLLDGFIVMLILVTTGFVVEKLLRCYFPIDD